MVSAKMDNSMAVIRCDRYGLGTKQNMLMMNRFISTLVTIAYFILFFLAIRYRKLP